MLRIWRQSGSDRPQPERRPASGVPQPTRSYRLAVLDGVTVHGLYYPPANPDFEAEGAPPVIVYIHGGPTSQVFDAFNLEADFFTSRGYGFSRSTTAVAPLWRAYRDALKGEGQGGPAGHDRRQPGADRRGLDPARLVIKGGSAGGYTLLNALVHHPGFFKAGLCSYGVSNLFDLDT